MSDKIYENRKLLSYNEIQKKIMIDEYGLYRRALTYEMLYFNDMMLKKFEKDVSEIFYLDKDSRKECKSLDTALEQIQWNMSIENWDLDIVDDGYLGGAVAECYLPLKTILIIKSHKKSRITLLHEMIHAYEFALCKPAYHIFEGLLLIDLYDRLSKRIIGLKKYFNKNSHIIFNIHSPLFMLKSLDLDVRLGFPLGTIYSYGKVEEFMGMKKV